MENEITALKSAALPVASMADLYQIGQLLVQTELFGTKNPADGFVIAVMCRQSGMTYVEFMQNFHFIKGRIAKRADAILADFQKAGGEIEIAQRDEEGSVVHLALGKNKYTSKCLWREIQGEPFARTENYKTPRKRMQMMWARAVSDGVRVVYPAAVQGIYTPEETEDFTEADAHVRALPEAEAARRTLALLPPAASPAPCPPPPEDTADPFTLARNTMPPDHSACPIEGKLFRMKWEDMPTEHLNIALGLDMPQAYKDAIAEVIARRQEGATA